MIYRNIALGAGLLSVLILTGCAHGPFHRRCLSKPAVVRTTPVGVPAGHCPNCTHQPGTAVIPGPAGPGGLPPGTQPRASGQFSVTPPPGAGAVVPNY